MAFCVAHKSPIPELTVHSHFNESLTNAPNAYFLPLTHGTGWESEKDITTARAVLKKYLKPNDTVYVEFPRDRDISTVIIEEIRDVPLPQGVVVKGWDDPETITKIDLLFTRLKMLDAITPAQQPGKLKALGLNSDKQFQQAMDFLNDQKDIAHDLPDPSRPGECSRKLNALKEKTKRKRNEIIRTTFVTRGRFIEESLKANHKGNVWFLGGRRHFIQYTHNIHPDSDQNQAVTNLQTAIKGSNFRTYIFEAPVHSPKM